MKKTSYTTPEIQISAYYPTAFIALSWSDEETTDEALTPERGGSSSDEWEDFWDSRE